MELRGKKIAFLGDSITEGVGVSDPNNRYDRVIAREQGLAETWNFGVGGTRIAHQQKPSACARWDYSFCSRAFFLPAEADVIVVYGGVNDFIHGDAPIGDLEDKTPATFCGAVEYLMNTLSELYPKAQLVFMTAAHCSGIFYDLAPSTHAWKQADAQPLAFYVDTVLEKGKQHGIPVLDLYRTLPIDPHREEDAKAYTTDCLHFNDAGHAILAKHLTAFLKSL